MDKLEDTSTNLFRAATVQKIINEVLAANPAGAGDGQTQNMAFAKEARDLLIECCVEFITMLSSEANDIAEKDAKKTIACEHINKALQDLGFGDYVPELNLIAENFKSSQVVCTPFILPCP
jgi:down-regulator of transcription 1